MARVAKKYWLLLEREDGQWQLALGAYKKSDVQDEFVCLHENGRAKKDLRLVESIDTQDATCEAVFRANQR